MSRQLYRARIESKARHESCSCDRIFATLKWLRRRLRLAGDVADLAEPKATLDGTYRAYGLDGALNLVAGAKGNSELVLPRFRLTVADGVIEGSLRIALDTYLTQGSINGRVPDLARWSKFAGTPLGGSLDFGGKFEDRRGQSLDLSLTGSRLAAGTASSRLGAGRIELIAKFADVMRAPSGMGRLSLASVSLCTGEFTTATLALDAPRPGRFAFQGEPKGHPLTLAFAGDGGLEPGRMDLRLTRLVGLLGNDRTSLEQPLTLSKRGTDLAFSGLAVEFGTGRITGSGGLRGSTPRTCRSHRAPVSPAIPTRREASTSRRRSAARCARRKDIFR